MASILGCCETTYGCTSKYSKVPDESLMNVLALLHVRALSGGTRHLCNATLCCGIAEVSPDPAANLANSGHVD